MHFLVTAAASAWLWMLLRLLYQQVTDGIHYLLGKKTTKRTSQALGSSGLRRLKQCKPAVFHRMELRQASVESWNRSMRFILTMLLPFVKLYLSSCSFALVFVIFPMVVFLWGFLRRDTKIESMLSLDCIDQDTLPEIWIDSGSLDDQAVIDFFLSKGQLNQALIWMMCDKQESCGKLLSDAEAVGSCEDTHELLNQPVLSTNELNTIQFEFGEV